MHYFKLFFKEENFNKSILFVLLFFFSKELLFINEEFIVAISFLVLFYFIIKYSLYIIQNKLYNRTIDIICSYKSLVGIMNNIYIKAVYVMNVLFRSKKKFCNVIERTGWLISSILIKNLGKISLPLGQASIGIVLPSLKCSPLLTFKKELEVIVPTKKLDQDIFSLPNKIYNGLYYITKGAFYNSYHVSASGRILYILRVNMGLEGVFLSDCSVGHRLFNFQKVAGGILTEDAKIEGLNLSEDLLNLYFPGHGFSIAKYQQGLFSYLEEYLLGISIELTMSVDGYFIIQNNLKNVWKDPRNLSGQMMPDILKDSQKYPILLNKLIFVLSSKANCGCSISAAHLKDILELFT